MTALHGLLEVGGTAPDRESQPRAPPRELGFELRFQSVNAANDRGDAWVHAGSTHQLERVLNR